METIYYEKIVIGPRLISFGDLKFATRNISKISITSDEKIETNWWAFAEYFLFFLYFMIAMNIFFYVLNNVKQPINNLVLLVIGWAVIGKLTSLFFKKIKEKTIITWYLSISSNSGEKAIIRTEKRVFVDELSDRIEASIQEEDLSIYKVDVPSQTIVNIGHADMRNYNVKNDSGQVVAGDVNDSTINN